ncbi:MAG: ABC transporter substrate-binding protein [bacterium]
MPLKRGHLPMISASAAVAVMLVLACALVYAFSGARPATAGGRTQITFWVGWAGKELDVIQRFVDEFNRAHPNLYVKTTSIANSYQKMKIAFAGNDTPDVCATVWTHELADYALRGALTPLDEYIAHSTRRPSDYYPAVWETYKVGNHIYALNQTMITFFMMYNKRIFREEGLDPERPPRTLEEFDDMAWRLTKFRGGDSKGELKRLGFAYGNAFIWSIAFGTPFWNPETRKIGVDCPQTIRCLKWLKSNTDRYNYQRLRAFQSAFGNASSPNNPFISGKVAMILDGDWYRSIIDEYAPADFEYGWFPIPAPPEGRTASTYLMSSMFVIPAASRHKDAAWLLIEWMTSAYVSCNVHVGKSPGGLPSLRAAAAEPEYREPYWQFVSAMLSSPNAMPPPKFPLFERFISDYSRMEDYVLSNVKKPEEAAAELQRNFQTEVDTVFASIGLQDKREK